MADPTRGRESEAEEQQPAVAHGPGPALPAGVGAVLAMQRSAGNAAVVRALGAGRAAHGGAVLARLSSRHCCRSGRLILDLALSNAQSGR